MSASKRDRTTAPRTGSRPSRAKHVDDRNVAPPAGYRPAGKRKPGEAAMEAQLEARTGAPAEIPSAPRIEDGALPSSASAVSVSPPGAAGAIAVTDPDDQLPPKDPWWTDERERAFAMALQGMPQHQIAAELSRDRHTVARWMDDDRFVERLFEENAARFRASRQRRSVQTVRLTDKADRLANKFLDRAIELADQKKDDLPTRLAARDWLQEFRENSRREDEIFGLNRDRLDVNVRGQVQHNHKGKVGISFKAFLAASLRGAGINPDEEEVDGSRADEALASLAERALAESTFLDELVEREKEHQLAPVLAERG